MVDMSDLVRERSHDRIVAAGDLDQFVGDHDDPAGQRERVGPDPGTAELDPAGRALWRQYRGEPCGQPLAGGDIERRGLHQFAVEQGKRSFAEAGFDPDRHQPRDHVRGERHAPVDAGRRNCDHREHRHQHAAPARLEPGHQRLPVAGTVEQRGEGRGIVDFTVAAVGQGDQPRPAGHRFGYAQLVQFDLQRQRLAVDPGHATADRQQGRHRPCAAAVEVAHRDRCVVPVVCRALRRFARWVVHSAMSMSNRSTAPSPVALSSPGRASAMNASSPAGASSVIDCRR